MQARAAEIALTKQARPEVHTFAQSMLNFRQMQIPSLEGLAQGAGIQSPAILEFEHAIILENLAPLDFIAFSRRWAEVQIQALQQEMQIYGAAGQAGANQAIAGFWGQMMPQVEDFLAHATKIRVAIGE